MIRPAAGQRIDFEARSCCGIPFALQTDHIQDLGIDDDGIFHLAASGVFYSLQLRLNGEPVWRLEGAKLVAWVQRETERRELLRRQRIEVEIIPRPRVGRAVRR